MKKLLIVSLAVFLFACKNGKKDDGSTTHTISVDTPQTNKNSVNNTTPANKPTPATSGNTLIVEGGKELSVNGSMLVDKDKLNLKAGAPYRGMITTSQGPNKEGLILRFVFDTKPGTYPVTGMSFGRGDGDKAEQYGGLLGGAEKIYDGQVTLTECKDLGDNNAGGHKWSISGTVENLVIPAMGIMLMDKTKNHPKEIKLDKISFTGLTFDDNAEEMLKKAMEQYQKMKKN